MGRNGKGTKTQDLGAKTNIQRKYIDKLARANSRDYKV